MTTVLRRLLLVAACFLALSASTPAQSLFFQPPTYVGSPPTVTADINGDGKPDLLSSDGTVQLGKGNGTFTTGTPWTTGQPISQGTLVTGDFNGDGKTDLLVSSGTSLYVLLGNGDGTFQPAIMTNIGTSLGQIQAADLNGDGKLDVVGVSGSSFFAVLGKGDGSFASAVPYAVCITDYAMTTGDFNGDGKPDVAVACRATGSGTVGTLQVYLGHGDGTFATTPVTSPSLTVPAALATGDFNGDGKLDLAVADGNIGGDDTLILLGNGDGTFTSAPSSVPATGVLTVADVNGDHKLDLVIGDAPFVEVFLGNGDGSFVRKDSYLASDLPASLVIADFNGDGRPDIATGNILLLGNGDGSFQGDLSLIVGPDVVTPPGLGVTGDFNGDGNPDVAILSSNTLYIALSDGAGGFSLAHTYPITQNSYAIASADLNADGKLDLVLVVTDPSTQDWSLVVMLGNGDGSFGAPTTYAQGAVICCAGTPLVSSLAVVDLNGDHKPDVIVINPVSSELAVFLNKGDGTFAAPVSYFTGSQPNSFVVGDFNNDGILDLVVSSSAGLGVLLGKGDGTFQSATFSTTPAIALLASADVNGDGNVDLVTESNSVLQILLGNGNGTFTALAQTSFLVSGVPTSVVDVNGDGKLDLVQINPQRLAQSVSGLDVFLGNGDGTFASPALVLPVAPTSEFCCLNAGLALIADFNHDSRPDIAVTVNSSSAVSPWGVTTLLNTAAPPQPNFLVSAKPFSPTPVKPGDADTSTVTVTSVGGFSGSVALSCSGLPSGATCGFAPASVSNSGSSTLTVNTTSSTPVGTYSVTITGTSAALTNTVVVALTVATSAGTTTATLAPNSLTFAQQAMGTGSSPQTVQLTNTGSSPLNISGVSINGANASDFTQTNTCTSPVAAAASCQISVTFKPTGMGSRSASLSVSDNATASPQMVALSGSGPDFSLSAGSTSSATVMPGQTATYTITAAPSAGFNQTVALTCTGAPTLTTCSISPSSRQLNGTSSSTAMVTITTTAPSMGRVPPLGRNDRFIDPRLRPFLVCLVSVILILMLFARRPKPQLRWAAPVAFVALLLLAATLSSCGGGSSSSGTGSPGTAAGTYTITVTGTAGTGSSAATHTTTLTLVVQ